MRLFVVIISLLMLSATTNAQKEDVEVYKQIDTLSLTIEIYYPQAPSLGSTSPAMVYFFGGGWSGGSTRQFKKHAAYFSSRGITCFLVNYRIRGKHNTTPFESLKDAKSAIRYIRKNADKFMIDKDKIIAAGGSAGGHLAAATALCSEFNEEGDDMSISCIPNVLVLFNPVIDNGPGGFGYDRIGEKYKDFSPLHNINVGAPPTIFLLGTEDILIPVETAKYYQTVMEKVGSRCDLKLYEGKGRGFFNYKEENPGIFQKTVYETDKFLESLGYLEGEPSIKVEK
ncbi:MAG: alpha/beta hydrolase [Bacteroidales bacterium]|nr:alpha/beta hydrolase [Bacteroidales bacterium]